MAPGESPHPDLSLTLLTDNDPLYAWRIFSKFSIVFTIKPGLKKTVLEQVLVTLICINVEIIGVMIHHLTESVLCAANQPPSDHPYQAIGNFGKAEMIKKGRGGAPCQWPTGSTPPSKWFYPAQFQ